MYLTALVESEEKKHIPSDLVEDPSSSIETSSR